MVKKKKAMKSDLLKNSELFIFLSLVFSIFTATLLSNQAALNKKGDKLGTELKKCRKNYLRYRDSLFRYKDSMFVYRDSLFRYKDSMFVFRDSLFRYKVQTAPHIEIKGTDRFFFQSGEASMTDKFKNYINDNIIPLLLKRLDSCNSCNAIYLVGHTDAQIATQEKNIEFDKDVVDAINNDFEFDFKFNSNTDLGLMRAFSIYKHLSKNEKLRQRIKYWFPLSAGPFINPITSKLITNIDNNPQENKRRIEIWLYAYKKNK